ncbi:MAG: hypothetical protein ACRD3W_16050 [Terriglobales bacterium]
MSTQSTMTRYTPYGMIARRFAAQPVDRAGLLTLLDFMLDDAEKLFGKRRNLHPYVFEGIYFASSHGRFEYSHENGRYTARIRLASGTLKRHKSAIWTLSHECIHLLSAPGTRATVLEEGLACWYQKRWVRECPELFPEWAKSPDRVVKGFVCNYDEAHGLVDSLISQDETIIKKLRQLQPETSRISASMIARVMPEVDRTLARRLTQKFKRIRRKRDEDNSVADQHA